MKHVFGLKIRFYLNNPEAWEKEKHFVMMIHNTVNIKKLSGLLIENDFDQSLWKCSVEFQKKNYSFQRLRKSGAFTFVLLTTLLSVYVGTNK